MTKRATTMFLVLVVAALFVGGCKGGGPKIVAPTPIPNPIPTPVPTPEPTPTPEPNPYPDLPHRVCAKNLETDEELPDCRMWVELQQGIKPPRGSKVKVGDQYCPDPNATCFELDLKYGFKGISNPNVGMRARVYFSMDGKTPVGESISIEFQMPGERMKHYGPRIFSVAPRYLLIQLDYEQGCGECDPAEEGWVSFLLNYGEM